MREFKHARCLLVNWEEALFEEDDHSTQESRLRNVRGGGPGRFGGKPGRNPSGRDEMDPAVASEVILSFERKHYAEWIDIPVPALGNVTPREAARSVDGRRRLETLLGEMALMESRGDPETAYDFGGLRKALGLNG